MKKKNTKSDWRVKTLSRIRALMKRADPKIVVEMKYKMASNPAGIPVWYRDGMICTGETYKLHLRLTFAKGNLLKDPKGLINSFRAMIIKEDDKLDEKAFTALIREAVALNQERKDGAKKPRKKP